jgi:hypothetical protein
MYYIGGDDECARAANIYQCGREKAPVATDAIQVAAASKNAPVSFYKSKTPSAYYISSFDLLIKIVSTP